VRTANGVVGAITGVHMHLYIMLYIYNLIIKQIIRVRIRYLQGDGEREHVVGQHRIASLAYAATSLQHVRRTRGHMRAHLIPCTRRPPDGTTRWTRFANRATGDPRLFDVSCTTIPLAHAAGYGSMRFNLKFHDFTILAGYSIRAEAREIFTCQLMLNANRRARFHYQTGVINA
jgi:hypothetical protein